MHGRIARGGIAAAVVALGSAIMLDPAGAQICIPTQYDPCPTTTTAAPTTTTTVAPTTTTTRPGATTSTTSEDQRPTTTLPPTTTTDAPPPASTNGTTSKPTPLPGEAVPISAPPPAAGAAPVLDATKPAAAVLVSAGGDNDIPMPAPTITQNANGSVSISVTVPPATPPGVYLIAVVGTDALGNSRAIIVPVVVRRRAAQSISAATIQALEAITPTSVTLPKPIADEVDAIVASVDDAGGAAAVADAVLDEGAELNIENARLLVSLPDEGSEASRPLVAAFAVALGGAGLVLVRRRTPAVSTRST